MEIKYDDDDDDDYLTSSNINRFSKCLFYVLICR